MPDQKYVANNATTWALAIFESSLSPTQKLICLYLRTHMNDYRDCAWPSVDRIAEKCGLGRRAVFNNLPLICEAGYLERDGMGAQGTIRYSITIPDGGGASGARVHINTQGGASGAPELTKELTNTLSKGKAAKPAKKKPAKQFKRPTLEQVTSYCAEKGYTFDPEQFINHYNSNGWKVGRASMKCWQSACATWNKREKANGKARFSGSTSQPDSGQRLTPAQRTAAKRALLSQ